MPHHRTVRTPLISGCGVLLVAVLGIGGCSSSMVSVDAVPMGTATAAAPQETPAPAPTDTAASAPAPVPASSSAATSSPTVPATPLPSVSPTPEPLPTAPVGSFVLGDSISLSIAPALSRLGYPVVGKVGQSARSPYLAEHLSSAAAQAAPAWVIVLGTNNPGNEEDIASVREWVRTIRGLRSADQQVFWVTPYRPSTYSGGMSAWTLDALNAELAAIAERRDWLTLLDFASIAEEEWYAQDGQHLHPDLTGQEALVRLIAGADATPAEAPAPITTIAPPEPDPTTPAVPEEAPESMEFGPE
jgi:hypothetical protein